MGGFTRNEKRLIAGLWALPAVGARGIENVLATLDADSIIDLPFSDWVPSVKLPSQCGDLLAAAREAGVVSAAESSDRLREHCHRTGTRVTYLGDPEYPELLGTIDRAPQLLFYKGPGADKTRRFRVAMVGSRKVESHVETAARTVASELARAGVCIVSGAADGVDRSSHFGALDVRGQTWAFLGSSIDQIDGAPRKTAAPMLARGGTIFSDYPPGVRGGPETYPRRNRLIAGAAELTLVVRAGEGSGALYTSDAARELGRPLYAMPGEVDALTARGTNELLRCRKAYVCLDSGDILEALGMGRSARVPKPIRLDKLPDDIGPEAKCIWELLAGTPMDFDTLMVASGLSSGSVSAGLTALELIDAVLERSGRVYYRAQ